MFLARLSISCMILFYSFLTTNLYALNTIEKALKKTVSLNQVLESTIKQGLENKDAVISLHRSYMNVADKLAQMSPRLRVSIGSDFGTYGVNIASSLIGLLGVFVPSHWFNLKSSIDLYKSEKYAFLSIIFNQYHLAKNSFYQMNKLQAEVTIYRLYVKRLQEMITLFKTEDINLENDNEIKILQSLLARIKTSGYETIQLYYQLLPELLVVMGLSEDHEMVTLDYEPEHKIILKRLDYQQMKQFVIEGSYEVRSTKALITERKTAFWGRSVSFISLDDSLKIDIGPHILTGMLLSYNDIKKIKVQYKRTRLQVAKELKQAIALYKTTIPIWRSALEGKKVNENSFLERWNKHLQGHEKDIDGYLHLIEFGLTHDLAINDCYYRIIITESNINRLTRSEAPAILNLLPNDVGLWPVRSILKNEIKKYLF